MTTTTQNLKLISEAPYNSPMELNDQVSSHISTLLFDQDFQVERQDVLQGIQLILEQLSSTTSDDKSRVEMFTQLVHTMRKLTHSQLVQIFHTYENLETMLFDALPLLKTDAAITLMRDFVENGKVSGDILDTWFATLPYYKNPSRGMINSALVSCKHF